MPPIALSEVVPNSVLPDKIKPPMGVEPSERYLAACASIVFPEQRRRREDLEWTPNAIAAVAEGIEHFPSLSGYAYEG